MGRDIHVVLEYDPIGDPPFSGTADVLAADVSISRNYELFHALAGAGGSFFLSTAATLSPSEFPDVVERSRAAIRDWRERPPLFPARGLPPMPSLAVLREACLCVHDEGEPRPGSDEHWIPRSEAEALVQDGRAHYLTPNWGLILNPEYHTPSHLDLAEIRAALAHSRLDLSGTPPEFRALVAMMEAIEVAIRPGCSRIVFWFDN